MTPREKLLHALEKYPNATIVTDVGASLFSGWGQLKDVIHSPKEEDDDMETLELIFA